MGFSLVLDILVAGLLVVTISYAVMLNRRLRTMRQDKSELEKLAVKFADATVRAEESTSRLRKTAEELRNGIDKAKSLREDLTFLIDRGASTCDRLEESVRLARREAPPGPREVKPESKRPVEILEEDPKSEAERELIKALRSAR
ncbi:MAG: DUF6468 domain-containing protein [Rhodospirillales bacterium]|nr:DUF6468 domain-containing protein [Rhodospirillales bacterium]